MENKELAVEIVIAALTGNSRYSIGDIESSPYIESEAICDLLKDVYRALNEIDLEK